MHRSDPALVAGSLDRGGSRQRAEAWRTGRRYLPFILPALLVLAILTIVPIVMTFVLSLTNLSFTSVAPTTFVGPRNYLRLLQDSRFLESLSTSFILVTVPVLLQLVFGFVIALVMHQRLWGLGWLRIVFIAPMVMPPIVMGLMWKVLFTPQLGGVNYFLSLVGVKGPVWLAEPSWALVAIIIAALWGWTPFVALMLLTAMESLSRELYDASAIDGASWGQAVRYVMIPQLKPTLLVVGAFRIIEALAIFPIIFVVTGGGPAGSTETVNFYAYVTGFNFLRIGYASAIIFVFFLFLVVLLTPVLWAIVRNSEDR